MQRLWAPWRESYITKIDSSISKSCVFCGIFKSKDDRKNLVFLRNASCLAVLNLYPYSNGHCLILPNRHVADVGKLTQAEIIDMMQLLVQTQELLKKTLKPHGYNVGFNLGRLAGAGIPKHLHMHVVPRWKADHNFMPVLSHTKIISQSLERIYQLLTNANKKRPGRTGR